MVEGKSGVALWEADKVSGDYTLEVTQGVEAFVRPRKDTDPLNGVSTSDLVAIQKEILGKASLDSWYKQQAADANNDGKVSAIDLIQLRKLILGMIDHLPSSDSWRFFERESNKSFYHIDQMLESMKADFIGVKVGDVNASTDPSLKAGRSADAMTLLVNRVVEDNRVAFRASEQETITGIQFTLEFDASQLKIINVLPGSKLNLSGEHLNLTHQANGWITMSWNPTDGNDITINEGDEIFTLVVEQSEQLDLSESMTISSKVTRAEAYDQAGLEYPLSLNFVNGHLEEEFELLQNRPNPWSHETAIGFTVSAATPAILTVYDVSGRLVKQIDGAAHKGYQEWSIDARDMPHSGVYYYKLETNDHTAVRKMILMD
jgi:hypothetical protein